MKANKEYIAEAAKKAEAEALRQKEAQETAKTLIEKRRNSSVAYSAGLDELCSAEREESDAATALLDIEAKHRDGRIRLAEARRISDEKRSKV